MGIRTFVANTFIGTGRAIGNLTGLEMAVEFSDHSIQTRMELPKKSQRAWDPNLFKNGNAFVSGYANPIKPHVVEDSDLENPNRLATHVSDGDGAEGTDAPALESVDDAPDSAQTDGDDDGDGDSTESNGSGGPHVQLISSGRYREFMRQNLISQLLTPESRWNMLVWAGIAIAAIQLLTLSAILYVNGGF